MGNQRIAPDKKIALLQLIQTLKDTLFGKFSNELDNGQKQAAWQEVLLKAKSLEIVRHDREWTYVRDQVWSVWRTRALAKKDNKNKTGTGGGVKNALNDVDLLIIEILGKESPVICGLDIGESEDHVPVPIITVSIPKASMCVAATIDGSPLDACNATISSVPRTTAIQSATTQNFTPTKTKRRRSQKENVDLDADGILKRKRTLQSELMEVKIYKHKLEALKLEQELNLEPSVFTKDLK